MKKLIAIMLAAAMLLCLTACGAEEEPSEDLVITRAPATEAPETEAPAVPETEAPAEETEAPVAAGGVFAFVAEGVELIPGEAFDPTVLSEAVSMYEVPSCAIEGTDNVYNYETYEITAYDDGTGEVIYSIYFLDPNLTTPEGLALADGLDKVVELYGADYVDNAGELVYTRGNTTLRLIVQNDVVVSIEYRMITE